MGKLRYWFFLFVILLTACSGAAPINQSGAELVTPASTEALSLDVTAALEMKDTVVPPETPEKMEPTIAPAQVIATEFQPTDAGSVILGDGKPKLVEFFAFW